MIIRFYRGGEKSNSVCKKKSKIEKRLACDAIKKSKSLPTATETSVIRRWLLLRRFAAKRR